MPLAPPGALLAIVARRNRRFSTATVAAGVALLLASPPAPAQRELAVDAEAPAPAAPTPADAPPDEELGASDELVVPDPAKDATPATPPPGGGRGVHAAALFGTATALGTACCTCGLLGTVLPAPVAFACCGLTQGSGLLSVLYALCFVAAPVQVAASVLLALVMPFATMIAANLTRYQDSVRLGLVKVWLLSATSALLALLLGIVAVGFLLGAGIVAGYIAAFSGGVTHPAVVYTLWLVFVGAFGVATLLPVPLAIAAQLIPALVVQAFPEGGRNQ